MGGNSLDTQVCTVRERKEVNAIKLAICAWVSQKAQLICFVHTATRVVDLLEEEGSKVFKGIRWLSFVDNGNLSHQDTVSDRCLGEQLFVAIVFSTAAYWLYSREGIVPFYVKKSTVIQPKQDGYSLWSSDFNFCRYWSGSLCSRIICLILLQIWCRS